MEHKIDLTVLNSICGRYKWTGSVPVALDSARFSIAGVTTPFFVIPGCFVEGIARDLIRVQTGNEDSAMRIQDIVKKLTGLTPQELGEKI